MSADPFIWKYTLYFPPPPSPGEKLVITDQDSQQLQARLWLTKMNQWLPPHPSQGITQESRWYLGYSICFPVITQKLYAWGHYTFLVTIFFKLETS